MGYSRLLMITAALGIWASPAPAQPEGTDPLEQMVNYQGQSLGVGIATYLARQAGLKLDLPLSPELTRNRQFECQDTLRRCLQKLLGDGWGLTLEGDTLKVSKPAAVAAPPPSSVRYLVLSGGNVVGEGPFPKDFAPTMVVDQVVRKGNGGIDLTLSPLGPTCLVARRETVCLRATGLGDSGVVTVVLGGVSYAVRYRVASDDLVLYRVFLEEGAAMPDPVRKPPTPSVSTSPAATSKGKTTSAPTSSASANRAMTSPPVPARPSERPFTTLTKGIWECRSVDSCVPGNLEGRYLSLRGYAQMSNAERMARAVWAADLPLYVEVRETGGRPVYYLMTQGSTAGLGVARATGLSASYRQFPPSR